MFDVLINLTSMDEITKEDFPGYNFGHINN